MMMLLLLAMMRRGCFRAGRPALPPRAGVAEDGGDGR
jgi:hypothetical protein